MKVWPGEDDMCNAKKGRTIVECDICGNQLSEVEQEGVMLVSLLQAKLMAQVVAENPDLSVREIIIRWKDMGLVDTQCLALSF